MGVDGLWRDWRGDRDTKEVEGGRVRTDSGSEEWVGLLRRGGEE